MIETLQGTISGLQWGCADENNCSFDTTFLSAYSEILHSFRSPKRKKSFLIGRYSAAQALQRVSVDTLIVSRSTDGKPLWPDGIRGSISHTDKGGRVLALTALTSDPTIAGVGIDVEYKCRPLKKNLSRVVLYKECEQISSDEDLLRLFTLKESFYKAVSPLLLSGEAQPGFKDVSFTLSNPITMNTHTPELARFNSARFFSYTVMDYLVSITLLHA